MPHLIVEHEVEKALNGVASLRVLKVLLQNRGKYLSKRQIAKRTKVSNPTHVLDTLVKLGWVEEQAIMGLRLYKANINNPKVKALHELYKKTGYL